MQGLGGSSAGAADPAGAVKQLAEAANREDPAAALAVIDPREASALSELYGDVRDTATAAGTGATRADGSIAETDVELEDLQLDAEELADGVSRVRVSGGTLRAAVEASGIPSSLGLEQDAVARLDLARVASEGRSGLFVIVREREGRWFVSPELTALQYLVEAEELPEPDWSMLDEPSGDGPDGGPRTGEQLLDRIAETINTRNVSGAIELAAQDEAGPLRAFRGSLEALAGREDGQLSVAVTSSDVEERPDGDRFVRLDLANRVAVATFAFRPASYRVGAEPIEVRSLPVPGSVSGTIPRTGHLAAFRVRYDGTPLTFTSSSRIRVRFLGPLHEEGSCSRVTALMGPEPFVYATAEADQQYEQYADYAGPSDGLYDWNNNVGEYLLLVSGTPGARFSGKTEFE